MTYSLGKFSKLDLESALVFHKGTEEMQVFRRSKLESSFCLRIAGSCWLSCRTLQRVCESFCSHVFFQAVRRLRPRGSILNTAIRTAMVKYVIITPFQGFGHALMLKSDLPVAPGWTQLQRCQSLATHLASPHPHPNLWAGSWPDLGPPHHCPFARDSQGSGLAQVTFPIPALLFYRVLRDKACLGGGAWSCWTYGCSWPPAPSRRAGIASWFFFTISSLHRTRCQVTFNSLK